MPLWVHKTDFTMHESTSAADMKKMYPSLTFIDARGKAQENAEWALQPDLSAVIDHPQKYWTVTGNSFRLMSQAQRDAIDVTERNAFRDQSVQGEMGNSESVLRAVALVMLDNINALRQASALPELTEGDIESEIRNRMDR